MRVLEPHEETATGEFRWPVPTDHTALTRYVPPVVEGELGLTDEARARIQGGLAPNTIRAYQRDWLTFSAWCRRDGRSPLPASAITLAEYVTHLAATPTSRGLPPAPSTIERALGCIQSHHKIAGHAVDGRLARLALRDYRRECATAGRRPAGASPAELTALRAMVDTTDPETLTGKRDRALLVLGFAVMGRRSELAGLDIADLAVTGDGLEVLIRQSKTDQDAKGVIVPVPYGSHPETCPVRVTETWRAALADHGISSGPLLRGIDRHGHIAGTAGAAGRKSTRMSGHGINLIVKRAAQRAGLVESGAYSAYSAHSLRAGGATTASKGGASVSSIARHGRWSENSPVVHGYIRAADKWRDNPMRGIGL